MHARLRKEAEEIAKSSDNEVCGLALARSDGTVCLYPCTNVSDEPKISYAIAAPDLISASRIGRTLWIYHSHPEGPAAFSEADIAYAKESALPHWLYDKATSTWHEYRPPTLRLALEGRPFVWGESDCYSFLRDYYRDRHNIEMKDYPRDETSSWPNLGRLVLDHIEDEGFIRLAPNTPLKKEDTLIFRTSGSPQHFAVFLGNSTVVHHPFGALSRKERYNLAWQRRLHCIARYRNRVLG